MPSDFIGANVLVSETKQSTKWRQETVPTRDSSARDECRIQHLREVPTHTARVPRVSMPEAYFFVGLVTV